MGSMESWIAAEVGGLSFEAVIASVGGWERKDRGLWE